MALSGDVFLIPGHETDLEIPADGKVRVAAVLDIEGMSSAEQSRCLDGKQTGGKVSARAPGSTAPPSHAARLP